MTVAASVQRVAFAEASDGIRLVRAPEGIANDANSTPFGVKFNLLGIKCNTER